MNKENINNIIGNQASHILKLIDEGKIPEARACTENVKELWELYGFAFGYSETNRCFYLKVAYGGKIALKLLIFSVKPENVNLQKHWVFSFWVFSREGEHKL